MRILSQSLLLPPLALARAKAHEAREAALQAIARTAQLGDRLARIEDPANRLPQAVAEQARPDPWRPPRMLYRRSPLAGERPLPGSRVDRTA